jgi:hypothetical protein
MTPLYQYLLALTPESSVSCPTNAGGLRTAYMHHYCCMVAHSLDMQDPLPHTIPRPLQDTALRLSPYHHSYILRGTTPTDSLPHTGTVTATPELLPHDTRLQNTIPTLFPLSPDTDRPVLVILADCSICTAWLQDLRFHMVTTDRSGPSESTLTRDRDCSSLPWFAQPSAIEYRSSQYWSFSRTQGTVSGQLYPSLLLDLLFRQVGSSSLQDEVC